MRDDDVVRDGVRLRVRRSGEFTDRPIVLFVNAVGMVSELADGLAAGFCRAGFDFVTWDLRGSPGPSVDERDCTLDTHAADGLRILDELRVPDVQVVGWCTGASVALFLAERLGERMRSLVAADGAFLFDGVPGGPLGNAMYAMCGEIVADVATAVRYHELTQPRGNEATILGLTDAPELVEHMTLPYRQGVGELTRYAFAIRSACDYDPTARWAEVTRPTLLTARRNDLMVSHRNSVRAAEATGAGLHLTDTGGHYALFTDPAAAVAELAPFLHSTAARRHPADSCS